MNQEKVAQFIELAGQAASDKFIVGSEAQRKLGAQLLLSEVLEYCIKGLGVIPEFRGTQLTDANGLQYKAVSEPSKLEMLDGLADTAYTMYWNAVTFGIPVEEAFDLVCDNNLEKFVHMPEWTEKTRALEKSEWHCGQSVTWPGEVDSVSVIESRGQYYAVGKDIHGKVRKPSSYQSVDLSRLAA